MFMFIQQHYFQTLTVVLLTIVLILILRLPSQKLSLVDEPNERKAHEKPTPLIGGICIALACSLSSFALGYAQDQGLRSLIIFANLFLCLGVVDDRFDFKASVKLLIQLAISFIFIVSTGLQISNLSNPFALAQSYDLGFLSLPFTLLAMVGLTNAFNMIDGCDGLAASLAAFAILGLLYFGSSQFVLPMQTFLLMLVASIFAFLIFNFSNNPALKVFLGDGGSLFFGFIISTLLIKFSVGNKIYSPTIVLWFVAVPVYDFFAVVVRRLVLKRKVMSADRSHIHHYLLSFGLSHFQTTFVILSAAFTLLCLGVFLEVNYPSLSFVTFVSLFTAYLSLRLFNHTS